MFLKYSQINFKNLVILLTELVAVFLMALGILPNELSLFLTGLLIFYFIFSPIDDSLWVFIASIPLFVALPITENFDSMSNWRILLIILFLKTLCSSRFSGISIKTEARRQFFGLFSHFYNNFKKNLYWEEYLMIIFLVLGALSLLVAQNVIVGAKKLIFLINAFLLFIVIKNLTKQNRAVVNKIFSAIKTAFGLVLTIGFIQYLIVLFAPLYNFWQFWTRQIIPVFYGQALGKLLAVSNSWFSYYNYLPPTLRMFSVFPDSHSFAFFIILSLPVILTLIFLRPVQHKASRTLYWLLLTAALLAIIFSGSRGTWLSAVGVLIILLFFILLFYSPTARSKIKLFSQKPDRKQWSFIQLATGSLLVFFVLFPISSGILLAWQKVQMIEPIYLEKMDIFERAKSITDFSEASAKSRLEIWQKSFNSIMRHPFLGIGLGNFPLIINEEISAGKRGASAHNLYLDIAAEMGIFALLIISAFFYLIFQKIWRLFRAKTENMDKQWLKYWSGFFVLALLWILGYSFFDVVLFNDKVLLFFTANLAIILTSN